MPLLALQLRLIHAWEQARTRLVATGDGRDETGEVTGTTILLVSIAVAAAAVGVLVTTKLNTHAQKIP